MTIAARFAALLLSALVGACGTFGSDTLDDTSPGVMRASALTPAAAQAAVRVGSAKADVAAALGAANTIRFDSGWEVWVYRWPGVDRSPRAATELVVLIDRAGLVRKVRVRPGTAP